VAVQYSAINLNHNPSAGNFKAHKGTLRYGT
jgi:hypothetical protein